MQSYGFNKDILKLEPLRKNLKALDLCQKLMVIQEKIFIYLKKVMNYKLKYNILVIQLKVRVKFMENNPSWHYKSKINNEELKKLKEYFK